MKTYFAEISHGQTKLFVKEGLKTKRAFFAIDGHSFPFFYNSCKFDYDAKDWVFTPLADPYLDNVHENIFSFNLEFAGYRYDFEIVLAKFAIELVNLIDDTDYELVLFWNFYPPIPTGIIHHLLKEIFKHYGSVRYEGSFFYPALKHAALGFLSRHNNNDYQYVDDKHYFSSIVGKDSLSQRGDYRYEETIKTFSEGVKYSLEDDSLTDQQVQKIFRRAEAQYEKTFDKIIAIEIKDRKSTISVDAIEDRFQSGKKRFEKFVKSIAHPSRTFTCYIETETENINNYTLEIINRYLKIDKIVSDSALFYDYIMGYAQMLIKYHFKTLALLISKQAKKKNIQVYYDGHFCYDLSWYRPKEQLLEDIQSHALEELIVKKASKRISA